MTDQSESNSEQVTSARPKTFFPWVVIVVVTAMLVVLNVFDDFLAEAVNLDPGVKNLASLGLPMVAMLLIGGWYLLRRARSFNLAAILALICFVAPIAFMVLFQPIFGGNANVERFEPRFWGGKKAIVAKSAESSTSRLETTTEFDFPQFLGPNRNGRVENVALDSWNKVQPKELWKQPVGDAWSGFAIVNGFAITQEQRDDLECVVCYEIETGNTVWNYSVARRHEDFRGFGRVGPRATPTIHEGKVYATSGTGVIDCLNGEDGSLIWSFDLPAAVGIEQVPQTNNRGLAFSQENSTLIWGRSPSPLIVDDLLITSAGGIANSGIEGNESKGGVTEKFVSPDGATLIAIDIKSGREVWRGGNRMVAYGSPIVATVAGVRQILVIAEDHCVSHDPTTGEELWSFPWPGDSSAAANCSQVTVIDENSIMISKGYSTGAQIITFENSDGNLKPVAEARDPRALKTKFSNPVIYDGHAYAISDRFVECVDAKTLKKKWRRRGFGTGQLLLVGDKLLIHAESGKLALAEATPDEYRELGSIDTISGTCWNTLAIYNDLVLVRSDEEAACYRLPLLK